jgi:DNA-binding response OmpR family regulator
MTDFSVQTVELERRVRRLEARFLPEGATEHCLGDVAAWRAPRVLALSRSEEIVLSLLVMHGFVTKRQLFHALWGDRADGGPLSASSVFKVLVYGLRKKFAPHGVAIDCVHWRGYEMRAAHRERLRNWEDE